MLTGIVKQLTKIQNKTERSATCSYLALSLLSTHLKYFHGFSLNVFFIFLFKFVAPVGLS